MNLITQKRSCLDMITVEAEEYYVRSSLLPIVYVLTDANKKQKTVYQRSPELCNVTHFHVSYSLKKLDLK